MALNPGQSKQQPGSEEEVLDEQHQSHLTSSMDWWQVLPLLAFAEVSPADSDLLAPPDDESLGLFVAGTGLPSIYALVGSPKAFTAFLRAGVGVLGLTALQGSKLDMVYSVPLESMSQASRKVTQDIYEYAYETGGMR